MVKSLRLSLVRQATVALVVSCLASCQSLIGVDQPVLKHGEGCQDGADCSSGFCADGVCCDAPCDGLCQTCIATEKGAGPDGECGDVKSMTDPASECAPGACDGSGHCRQIDGRACTDGAQCFSSFCADGVCCDTACDGLCQACTTDKKGGGVAGECGVIADGIDPEDECPGITTCASNGICSHLDTGSACTLDVECASGHCVEGVCQCVAQIAAGAAHACARNVGGSVWCWGQNDFGQVGDGTAGSPKPSPVQVAGLGTSSKQIAAGESYTCALKANGEIWCWGQNDFGQLGDGTTGAPKPSPVQVALDTSAVAIAAGGAHACALKASGEVWCWGRNGSGQVGDGTLESPRSLPAQVTALGTTAIAITAGSLYTCALLADGSVWCWGDNAVGQLGDGTTGAPKPSPVQVAVSTTAIAITAGVGQTCARRADNSVWCWGYNNHGQVGDATTDIAKPSPVEVAVLGTSAVRITAGGFHTCAIQADGRVWCWGFNSSGQVGDGTTTTPQLSPVLVDLEPEVVEIAGGYDHTCVRKADGSVWCWGKNSDGQIGDGTTLSPRPWPVKVASTCP